MNMPLMGANWWVRQGMGSNDPQIWRWTGPGQQTNFFCSLTKGTYRLKVRVINSICQENYNSLSFSVNGKTVACEQYRDDAWGIVYTGICAIDKTDVWLNIYVPYVMRLCDADPNSNDPVKLGVVITEIQFHRHNRHAEVLNWCKASIKQCLLTATAPITRVLPQSLKERLKSTTLGTKLRNYLHR